MLSILEVFWGFFFHPLFSLDINTPVYAPLTFCLLVLIVFAFVRRVLSWCFSL